MESLLLAAKQGSPGVDWPTLIAAIAALLTALMAALAVVLEGRRMRRQLGIDNMWRLIEQWDEPISRASVISSEAAT